MGLNSNSIKIVRQKDTILWFVGMKEYMERVTQYFTRDDRDFDKELGPRDPIAAQQSYQPKDPEPRLSEDKYTTRYTQDDGTQLSEGA